MRTVDVETLKTRMNDYLRAVRAGETVLVTDGDRVVAELTPPRPGRAPGIGDAMLAELVRSGILRPALVHSDEPPPRCPMGSLDAILGELTEDRASR